MATEDDAGAIVTHTSSRLEWSTARQRQIDASVVGKIILTSIAPSDVQRPPDQWITHDGDRMVAAFHGLLGSEAQSDSEEAASK